MSSVKPPTVTFDYYLDLGCWDLQNLGRFLGVMNLKVLMHVGEFSNVGSRNPSSQVACRARQD